MTRQENAKALRAVVADWKPIEEWAERQIASLRADLESQDASHVSLIAKLQGKIDTWKQVRSLDQVTRLDAGLTK